MDGGTSKALSFFVLLVFYAVAEHIDCGFDDGACRSNNNLTCSEDNTCTVSCTARNACRDATINCKDHHDCHIISTNKSSVRATTINCPSNANCLINGTAENNAFLDATINCGVNGSCYFLFNETAVGVSNFHFFKKLNATTSRYAKIYKYGLRQTSPNTTTSNISSSICCPVSSENNKKVNCEIFCGDFSSLVFFCVVFFGMIFFCSLTCFALTLFFLGSCDYLNIYAVNGFDDVTITVTGSVSMKFNESYMYCNGNEYNSSCSINEDECIDNDICDRDVEYNMSDTSSSS